MDLNLRKNKENLIFLPLGGANEIGMNLNLYHLDGKWIMVDCGVGFANEIPGVHMMVADISFIKQIKKDLLGIIITHIHEDHLGAVQYLWEEIGAPIYATNFGANFLRKKLEEYRLDKIVPINIIDGESNLKLGSFDIEFIGLTHSVPEMQALFIKTKKGNILHSGDWKFDPDPVVGEVSEKRKIKELGEEGLIDALVCDSTNAISPGHSGSEGDLYESLKEIISKRKGLVGVATFASNIARVHTIASVARDLGRKIVLAGFSLNRLYEVAKKSGYLLDDFDFISEKEIKFYDKKEILVIATGCQGEERAAARKIADDKHRFIRFTRGDLMVFSSKIIPGNEKPIFDLFSQLSRRNIDVITEKDHFVHVSGHPSQDELKEMYELAKPRLAIPVHGEFLHIKTHCHLAEKWGVEKTIQIENGLAVTINGDDLNDCKKIGNVKSGYLGVDGHQLIDLESQVIKERKKLQEAGIITISLVLDTNIKLLADPKIMTVGAYDLLNDEEGLYLVEKELKIILKHKAKDLGFGKSISSKFLNKKKKKRLNSDNLSAEISKTIRSKMLKIFEDLMGKRPAMEVFVHII